MSDKRLKILFVTQEDPLYTKVLFDEFFKQYPLLDEIKGVVLCSAMGKKSLGKLVSQMYEFYGLKDFIKMGVRYIFIKITKRTIENLCKRYKLPVFKSNNINSKEFIAYWQKEGIDVIVSVAAPYIFKNDLIALPAWGCINIHSGKLPHYKGMLPNFWQMLHGEKAAGVTVHKIDTKLDAGDIIMQKDVAIGEKDTLDFVIKKTKKFGARMIIEVLNRIRSGDVTCHSQSNAQGSYFSFPKKEDVKAFRRKGRKLL